jgi:hypothetical protein
MGPMTTILRNSFWFSQLRGLASIAIFVLATTLLPSSPVRAVPNGPGDSHLSDADRKHFLDGEFQIIKDTKDFPAPVAKVFCQSGDMRSCMANPGEPFNATDVISDLHVPRRRLILGGALGDKYFVYYEQGGYATSHELVFFRFSTAHAVETLWHGNCTGAAANIVELRTRIASGACWKWK